MIADYHGGAEGATAVFPGVQAAARPAVRAASHEIARAPPCGEARSRRIHESFALNRHIRMTGIRCPLLLLVFRHCAGMIARAPTPEFRLEPAAPPPNYAMGGH
jgi:hypothetical protein